MQMKASDVPLERKEQHTFWVKNQLINISGSTGHVVSVQLLCSASVL